MKKQITFLILVFYMNLLSFAQNNNLKFGISLNPNYSYRVYSNDIKSTKEYSDKTETGKYSYAVGLFIEKQIKKQLFLRLGINFMNTGFRTIKFTPGSSYQNPYRPNDPSIPNKFFTVMNYNYIEIPIDCQYFLGKKSPFFFDLGISPYFYLSNPTILKEYFANGTTRNTHLEEAMGVNKFGVALQFSFGWEIKLGSKIRIDIQPRFQYFLTSLINPSSNPLYYISNHVSDKLYNTGLQVGFKI